MKWSNIFSKEAFAFEKVLGDSHIWTDNKTRDQGYLHISKYLRTFYLVFGLETYFMECEILSLMVNNRTANYY